MPDGDASRRVTISTNAGAKVDLGLEGKIQSGTGVGTAITITRNKTKLVREMAAFHQLKFSNTANQLDSVDRIGWRLLRWL